jgi:hypothetical protein
LRALVGAYVVMRGDSSELLITSFLFQRHASSYKKKREYVSLFKKFEYESSNKLRWWSSTKSREKRISGSIVILFKVKYLEDIRKKHKTANKIQNKNVQGFKRIMNNLKK